GIRDGHVTGVQTCALPIPVPAAAKAVSIDNGGRADRSVEQLERGAATACRTPLRSVSDNAPEQCAPIDGRAISEARINAYEESRSEERRVGEGCRAGWPAT